MPPTSRRKKRYDEQLRGFQNRNIFAGVLLLIFAGLAIWLAVYLMPGAKPTVFVSTNYINHSGSRQIPFAKESCQQIQDAFSQHLQPELLELSTIHDVDHSESTLDLPKEQLKEDDVLVVYLNGHLIDQTEPDSGQASVGFLGPEAKPTELDLGKILTKIDDSPAKLKLVFLDAGRYSWSPVYPNRPLNKFSSSLTKALKNERWGSLSENFWVITSHTDEEISRVSTPMESSLFAKAIAESVKEMAGSDDSKLNVIELFEAIRRRTTSWSRNFDNHSLQTPVLIRPGVGVVTDGLADESQSTEFAVNWTQPKETDPNSSRKPSAGPIYTWQSFTSPEMTGKQAAERMLAKDHFDAAPFEEIQGLESFLELGSGFNDSRIDNYEAALLSSRKPPSSITKFNEDELDAKQRQTRLFRQSILGMAVLERFQNEMQFWEDATAINQLKILSATRDRPDSSGIAVGDRSLREREKLSAGADQFTNKFQDYLRRHEELIGMVDQKLMLAKQNMKDQPLTPTKVELLGRASQRYLPLIAAFKPPADTPTEPSKKNEELDGSTIVFDLESSTSKLGLTNVSTSDLYEAAAGQIALREPLQDSDTGYRFLLAAGGSESMDTLRKGIVPQIRWAPVEPKILFVSSPSPFLVNPFDLDPLTFLVSAQAIESIDLTLSIKGEEIPKGLFYGLNSNFKNKRTLTFKDGDGDLSRLRTKNFEVYIRHPRPDSLLGKPIAMKLTATDGKGLLEPVEYSFNVKLTKDPAVQLFAHRKIGRGEDWESKASLVRWGGKMSNWRPMIIKSLANVRSAFEFSLVNKSSRPKTLRAELYNVVDLPGGISQMDADRPKSDQVEELTSWLVEQQKQPGAISIQQSNPGMFTLIAETQEIQVPQGASVPAKFSVPLVGEKKEPTEASLQDQGVTHGMLIVFYEEKAKQPAWFQWLTFAPKEPADATAGEESDPLQPRADILDVFEPSDLNQFPDQPNSTEQLLRDSWIPGGTKDKPEPAASLTVVYEDPSRENRHDTSKLDLPGIFSGESLLPESNERALLLLNCWVSQTTASLNVTVTQSIQPFPEVD